MKKLFILLFSMVMAGEMEVDGNLTVTDTIHVTTIQSATIDSLLSLIAQLEQRIAQLECQNTGIIPDGYCDCFFHTEDLCLVCNGDNTVCADCAGVPNGDNLEDMCGICDNDSSNDCVQDCNGEWGGTAVEDVCGICGGTCDTWCGCDGICEAVEDVCGVCGGEAQNEDECIIIVFDDDGHEYYAKEYGDKIWMIENIRSLQNRSCYDNDPANCEIYGGLYTYDGSSSACPSGWHTATEDEFIDLYSYYGGQGSAGSALIDDELWTGTNESQFSAVPGGYYHPMAGNGAGYVGINTVNYIWFGGSSPRDISFYTNYNIIHTSRGQDGDSHQFSVRCVQN